MLITIALMCLCGLTILLGILSYIDLKERLLPNELVLGLAATGFVFHLSTLFSYVDLPHIAMGLVVGGAPLYLLRELAYHIYKKDALGLGDVKLMAAAGIWLGPEDILIATTIGALAGFIHGLAVAIYTVSHAKVPMNFSKFSVPAGPGFSVGILAVAAYKYHEFILSLFS